MTGGTLVAAKRAIKKGNFRAAEKQLRSVVAGQPDNVEGLFLLGRVLMQLGDPDGAAEIMVAALTLAPANAQCLSALGAIRYMQGRYEESGDLLRRALAAAPDQTEVMGNLGLVSQHLGWHDDALRHLDAVARRGGGTPKILEALAAECLHQALPDRARAVLRQLTEAQPANAAALAMLGMALSDCGQTADARTMWRKAEKIDPSSVDLLVARARFHRLNGDIEQSISLMEKTLAMAPSSAVTLFFWAYTADRNEHAGLRRADVLTMAETALAAGTISHEDRVRLEFACGKLLENDGRPDRAMSHYMRANRLVWSRQPMEKAAYRSVYEAILSAFDSAFFDDHQDIVRREPDGNDRCGEGLIFIVGMPRSGTTLVERIVTRREDVHAGGERPDMDALGSLFNNRPSGGSSLLSRVRELAGKHHARIGKITDGAASFTDKSPRNFMNLGLIACLFPRATVIHCVRNPVDTCLSCYSNHFGYNSVKYSYDQEVLGYYYSLYRDMMGLWKERLPITIHDAVYESLVREPEKSIRSLVRHCGFPWNDAFLHPEKGAGAARTASLAQVKKPIYTDSVNRWEPYREHLKPLLSALGDDGRM